MYWQGMKNENEDEQNEERGGMLDHTPSDPTGDFEEHCHQSKRLLIEVAPHGGDLMVECLIAPMSARNLQSNGIR